MTWSELGRHQVLVYSTPWCPDCHRLKRILKAQGVPYAEVDIDADPAAAARLRALTGRTAIPYVQVDGGTPVRGWHDGEPGRFSESLFLSELGTALDSVGKP